MILEDGNGHKMNAMKVFSESIKYLKDHFEEKIESVKHVVETDIHWVLTVPAIWKDNAKQFMREAAQQVFFLFVILNFYICTIPFKKYFEDIKWGYSEAVTGRLTIQWQNGKKQNKRTKINNNKIHRKVKIKKHEPN